MIRKVTANCGVHHVSLTLSPKGDWEKVERSGKCRNVTACKKAIDAFLSTGILPDETITLKVQDTDYKCPAPQLKRGYEDLHTAGMVSKFFNWQEEVPSVATGWKKRKKR
jgi:hypothetical protein